MNSGDESDAIGKSNRNFASGKSTARAPTLSACSEETLHSENMDTYSIKNERGDAELTKNSNDRTDELSLEIQEKKSHAVVSGDHEEMSITAHRAENIIGRYFVFK